MVTLPNILLLLSYLMISTAGLIFLKMSDGRLLSLSGGAGIFFYGMGFIVWYFILSKVPLSVAFPVAAGGLIVATQITGQIIFKENLSLVHLGGVLLIIIGISLVTSGETHL
ncbi:MAG: hypothetical protein K9G26_00590 [Emcibacter sp.]|nr:hypothetical protein [Emcibacter sp.]